MLAEQSKNRYLLPIIALAVTMGIGLWFTGMSQANRINENRLERQQILADIRSEIEYNIAATLSSTEILAHEVMRSQGKVSNFNNLAQDILSQIGGINNLQLAPKGIVRRIYPLTGNVEALGHNILKDKRYSTTALATIESGQLTLAGPVKLVQGGGMAVIARKPVYLWTKGIRPGRLEDNAEKPPFWGFASALIMLDKVLDSPTLDSLADKGYGYQLGRMDSSRNKMINFAENGDLNTAWSDRINIRVPNGKWTLSIGTDSAVGTRSTAIELAMTLLLAFLTAAMTSLYLKRRGAEAPRRLPHQSLL